MVICLHGCETGPPRQDVVNKMETVIDESVTANREQQGLPDDVSRALIPTINLDALRVPQIEDEQHFDISVNNVLAEQFFLSLVDGTQYNMVIHPEVKGLITLNLRNVTIPDVMEAARDVYGFEFISTPYGFQVLPGRLRARIYQINYLNVERSGSSQTQVSSGSLTESNPSSASSGDGTIAAPRSSATAVGARINTRQPLTTFWAELQDSVQAIVGQAEGRSVVVNPQSGVVVVRALPNELREVEAYLQATQLVVQRQVILEAKILEVQLNEGFQAGINWGALLSPGNNTITAANVGGGSVLVNESGLSGIAGQTGNLDPGNLSPISGALSEAFGGVFTLAFDLGDFTAFIELLKTQGNVQVLSSPRVATMNNQKAIIKVGTDEFFVTDVTNTVSTTGLGGTNVFPSIGLTPFFSGIALDVTPQISEGGDVTLHVHPSISEVVDQQKTVTIGNTTQQLPLALSTVRESDSIVRARSGQVVVIGGLMQDLTDDRDASAPVLGDIPVLGNLFKHKKQRSVKSELVILLKPVVVNSSEEWSGTLEKTGSDIRRLRDQMNEPPKTFLNELFKPVEEPAN
ncbi:MAG: pilus (MSHA type) biogenesis protein MshL [Gammaproteobacteria bacterium RIFCSPLOWO2_02_FULL_47_50]|nr:MAG: pilus (MSHA type) biogenesis protein MshL [Gammaproteobacteria bacterium RIFCSPLOWO2_01_FULL_47_190]OGT81654.1 MAG: pilus (MSHA type) biogenesis protein MshL [Gammaproteobacteria bacterium RIFCSPLOWO2_02_FULL_47_50]OGT85001.1 MAG: pilus (MSHA type) biogenesis protein MshL [Gammaproteobacteria bacterium RIFCSPLOWO2_12_FULL_47_76]